MPASDDKAKEMLAMEHTKKMSGQLVKCVALIQYPSGRILHVFMCFLCPILSIFSPNIIPISPPIILVVLFRHQPVHAYTFLLTPAYTGVFFPFCHYFISSGNVFVYIH